MSDIAGMQERIEDLQADGAKAAMWRTDAIAELLAELRKRDEALERVEALAEEHDAESRKRGDISWVPPSLIRAAVTGDGA